jgi:hypothetical protein
MEKNIVEKLAESMMARVKRREVPCLMCGTLDVEVVGVFVPTDKNIVKLISPEHKTKICAYALCHKCREVPIDKIEVKIVQMNQEI